MKLTDTTSECHIIAALMAQPELTYNDSSILLSPNDFSGTLNKMVYGIIFNLAQEGFSKILPQEIATYVSQFPTLEKEFDNKGGLDYLQTVSKIETDKEKFTYHYNRVKKITLLRDLKESGITLPEFASDNNFFDTKKQELLNETSVEDIVDKVKKTLQVVENKNIGITTKTGVTAATGLRALMERLKLSPDVGLPFQGDILNYSVRGRHPGKMYLYSAPSGHGKTRFLLGQACAAAFPRIENNQIVGISQLKKVLFIPTEMTAEEIQPLIVAYVSGVSEHKIRYHECTDADLKLINKAIEIIEYYEQNLIIEQISEPSLQTVKSKITNYIIKSEVEEVYYDYIFSSAGLFTEFSSSRLREDVLLMMLSTILKDIAAVYNIVMVSATQLNESWEKTLTRTANCIRGAKAIADKIDVGLIGVKLFGEEKTKIEEICRANPTMKVPNLVIDLYKNRQGSLVNVKILRYFEYGTCRVEDLFIVDGSYNVLDPGKNFEYESFTPVNVDDWEVEQCA